jgi:hypothetical protein
MLKSKPEPKQKRPRGRPKAGQEYPVERIPARHCRRCKGTGPFRSNRSAMINGGRKIEWLRCQNCFQVTRFESPII